MNDPIFEKSRDRKIYIFVTVVTILICSLVALLIEGPRLISGTELNIKWLPHSNALMNALTTILLLGGLISIKLKKEILHKKFMMSAYFTSSFFLIGYVAYHLLKESPKSYVGEFTSVYYFILISHIILAASIVPFALLTLIWGYQDRRQRHKKIARITFPIWMYVSITGVVIYFMLHF